MDSKVIQTHGCAERLRVPRIVSEYGKRKINPVHLRFCTRGALL